MRARPISIAIVGWLFVAVGLVGLAGGTMMLLDETGEGFDAHLAWATASQLASIVGGAFLLSGRNWARWLLVAWMAFHIVLSATHDVPKLLVRCAIFAPILYVLFRPATAGFFARARAAGTQG
jgi:hypothetical protein